MMVASLWPVRTSERIYLALLLLFFLWFLTSSPFVEHAQSIIQPVWDAHAPGTSSDYPHNRVNDTDPTDTQASTAVHNHSEVTTAQALDDYFEHDEVELVAAPTGEELDQDRVIETPPYIKAIMDPKDAHFDRLQCPRPLKNRYKHLISQRNMPSKTYQQQQQPSKKRYLFALNLYQCAYVLPRLLASIVEAMRTLGPETCVLSIVGGRSDDGTTEILSVLKDHIEALNVTYYFGISDIDPLKTGNDRVTELAKLRNLAVAPLFTKRQQWSTDATVIFVNDVSICTDDILELIYQKHYQQADMVCAMDWNNYGDTFYDSWIARSLKGDMFVEVPQSGSFDFAWNLFWNDKEARQRVDKKLPLQVFACWNGVTAFKAEPLLSHHLKFRAAYKGECYTGEPTLFCKDFWALGYGRIAVIPSVNIGYNDDQSKGTKAKQGYTSANIQETEHDLALSTRIEWKKSPPELIKCQPEWTLSSWVPWDEGLDEHLPYDWTRSGYFNAKKPFDKDLEFEDEVEDEEDLDTDEHEKAESRSEEAMSEAPEESQPEELEEPEELDEEDEDDEFEFADDDLEGDLDFSR